MCKLIKFQNLATPEMKQQKVSYHWLFQAKVGDFGLAREGSEYSNSRTKFPVRWTAPEALKYKKFTLERWACFQVSEMTHLYFYRLTNDYFIQAYFCTKQPRLNTTNIGSWILVMQGKINRQVDTERKFYVTKDPRTTTKVIPSTFGRLCYNINPKYISYNYYY